MASERPIRGDAAGHSDARLALLKAGAKLMVDPNHVNPYASLRVRTVCEDAGVSTGAFYFHWDGAEDYFEDLSAYLLGNEASRYAADFEDISALASTVPIADRLDALLGVATRDFDALIGHDEWDAIELFGITWGRSRYRSDTAASYRAIDRKTAEAYGALLIRLGREPRDPLTLVDLGVVLQGLIEGLGLRSRVDAEALTDGIGSSDHNLYATAVACVIAVMTRAADDGRDLSAVLGELLAEHAPGAGS